MSTTSQTHSRVFVFTFLFHTGLAKAAVVPASTSILSRSEASRSLNLNYIFYRYPVFSTTSFQPFQTTNFLHVTTEMPPETTSVLERQDRYDFT